MDPRRTRTVVTLVLTGVFVASVLLSFFRGGAGPLGSLLDGVGITAVVAVLVVVLVRGANKDF